MAVESPLVAGAQAEAAEDPKAGGPSAAPLPAQVTCLELPAKRLNGSFGAVVEPPMALSDLMDDPSLPARLVRLWLDAGGLLVLRGLQGLRAEQLVTISSWFGEVEWELDDSKQHLQVTPGVPVMRIGNTRDADGRLNGLLARDSPLPANGSPQYRPAERRPAWHTDSVYRERPPVGSALYCHTSPLEGGATCFSDAVAGLAALGLERRRELEGLESICSLAHHDAKVNKTSPDCPTLDPAKRAANPPRRVPLILRHPLTGRDALYGMNASVCAVVPVGTEVPQERLDEYELNAVEDESVQRVWRDMLPLLTEDRFTVVWQWADGDLVVWDNRSTMHCATGFDSDKYAREMWRTTIATDGPLGRIGLS